MARRELHSSDTTPEQRPYVPQSAADREPEIIPATADAVTDDYLQQLAFYEEPVTIRITPSSEKNAASFVYVSCNGRFAEFLRDGRWIQAPNGYLPVGLELTVKRSTVAILAGSRVDTIETVVIGEGSERPHNTERRMTMPGHSFSVLHDPSPRGAAWLTALLRRN